MRTKARPEIVINSSLVTPCNEALFYEFVLNEQLTVIECGFVESLAQGLVTRIDDFPHRLEGMLFELNHVRVNPKLDNTKVLAKLAQSLEESGVYICNPPSVDMMAMCFKPLGELSDIVRFYLSYQNKLIFLSQSVRLRRIK